MLPDYGECERRVLLSEGGYTNDPRDPGGPTNWGITLGDARLHWKPDATAEDVRAMPLEVAQRIYKEKYWDKLRCDELPAGLDYTVFDYGVNSGVIRAARVLDALDASMPGATTSQLVTAIDNERLAFLHRLPTWDRYGPGWTKRVASVKAYSLHLAEASSPAPAHHAPEETGKAYGDHIDVQIPLPQPKPTQPATIASQSASPVRPLDPPATHVAQDNPPPYEAPRASGIDGHLLASLGLGGSGALDLLQQANDYASQISMAKFNLQELNVSGVFHWTLEHPLILVPVAVMAAAIYVWEDHKKYKRLLQAATARQ